MSDDKFPRVSSIYKKLSHTEHVRHNYDTYVGLIEKHTDNVYVLHDDKIVKNKLHMSQHFIKLSMKFLSIVLTKHVRLREAKSQEQVSQIKVNIDKETGEIQIYNNGEGIDVVFMEEHKCYVSNLSLVIFLHLPIMIQIVKRLSVVKMVMVPN